MKKILFQVFENITILNPKNIAILLGVAMFFSCKTDLDTIETITRKDESPIESATGVKLVYSSYANVRMILEAPRMDRYEYDEEYLEMPEGIHVVFYDSLMNATSTLSAKYAISYENKEVFEARNDVVVVNEMNEKLNTEHLIWDRQKGIIYSEKFVKITTDEEVLYGEGFESDERFTQWEIKRPRGTFSVETGPSPDREPRAPEDRPLPEPVEETEILRPERE
jgi:LPS export ABC transporter protein LptC